MAAVATLAVIVLSQVVPRLTGAPTVSDPATAALGKPAPAITGQTLDGTPISLDEFRGRPLIVNFWGPSCVPCRTEFPLFLQKLAARSDEQLVIVGVLMDDPPEPARDFVAEMGATWQTVIDPDEAIQRAYRVLARPTSFFVDADGTVRAIQVGELTDRIFDLQFATIAPGS